MVSRVSVREVKVAVARMGATVLHVDWLQIHSLREAGLGGYTGVRSRRKVAVARMGATFCDVDWLQIHSLREAGLGGFTSVRSRRKMFVRNYTRLNFASWILRM